MPKITKREVDGGREIAAVKEGHPVKYSSMYPTSVCNNRTNFKLNYGDGGWCSYPGARGDQWVQIDAPKQVFWNKIETKARSSWFVKTYKLKYSNDGATWTDYAGTFTGNSDRTSIKANVLEEPINARMIRIYPLTFSTHTAMQFEAYYTQEYLIYTFYIYIYITIERRRRLWLWKRRWTQQER